MLPHISYRSPLSVTQKLYLKGTKGGTSCLRYLRTVRVTNVAPVTVSCDFLFNAGGREHHKVIVSAFTIRTRVHP
jgi:hypothetical protein